MSCKMVYLCDVCGEEMPDEYERPKKPNGGTNLMGLCRWDDACPVCRNAAPRIDVTEVLREAWRAAAKKAPELPDNADAIRKRAACDRLTEYRASHPLGSLKAVAKKMGKGWTDEALRLAITRERQLTVDEWDMVNTALDKLEQAEKREAASA